MDKKQIILDALNEFMNIKDNTQTN